MSALGKRESGGGVLRRLAAVLAVVALSIGVGYAAVFVNGNSAAIQIPMVALAVLSVLAFVFALKYDQDPFSPLAIIFFLVIMLYVCRPLWVLHANSWGPTRAFDDRAVSTAVLRSMTTALWIVLVSMLAAFIGYALVRLRSGNQPDQMASEAGEFASGRTPGS